MNIVSTLPPDVSVDLPDPSYPATEATMKLSSQQIETSSFGANSPMDSVSFSPTSTSMSEGQQERLLAIKEAVENGTYNVPSSVLANTMIKKYFKGV